jgi:cell division protein FtsQ|tara:strand:+ start:3689 stop:4366 length:678 start_codon:yes stop_codon:yes gene_type:complete
MLQSIGKKNKIIIYLIFLLILSTTSGKLLEKQKKYSLKIDNIKVFGLTIDRNLEIQNDLSSIFYQNIFFIGIDEINKIIRKNNIIEEYHIKKIYPSTLNIEIKPAKFIAKITNSNNLIVGSNGKLISVEQSDIILPYIFGEFNSKKFLEFIQKIKLSKFNFDEFKAVYFFPSNRWDVVTIDNVLIKLPEKNVPKSLNRAHKIITSKLFKNKNVIDLRIKNYLIIK